MANKVIDLEEIYQGRAFTVRRERILFQNGKTAWLDIIDHVRSVTILPMDESGNILFVRQYRHPAGSELLELPAGTLDPGEEPLECARREIREETGFAAGDFTLLGEFYLAPGYSSEYMYVYLATSLMPAPLQGDEDEFITLEPIPVQQAYEMALTGKLLDAKSLAALLLVKLSTELSR